MSQAALTSLTLAVPYYSNFPFLLRTIASVVAQSHPAIALVVCDDSPNGLSPAECEAMERTVAMRLPVRIVRTGGAVGMAASWSRCIDEADTDLVTVVHADDEPGPDYARAMVALAERHPEATALFCGARIIDGGSRPTFSFPDWYKGRLIPRHRSELRLKGDRAIASLLRGNYIFCPTLCYRRSKLKGMRFDARYRMVLDFDLVARILLEGGEIVGLPKQAHYAYRRHENNATAHLTKDLTRFREELAFYERVGGLCRERGFRRASGIARSGRIIRLNILYCVARDLTNRRFNDAAAKVQLLVQASQLFDVEDQASGQHRPR